MEADGGPTFGVESGEKERIGGGGGLIFFFQDVMLHEGGKGKRMRTVRLLPKNSFKSIYKADLRWNRACMRWNLRVCKREYLRVLARHRCNPSWLQPSHERENSLIVKKAYTTQSSHFRVRY